MFIDSRVRLGHRQRVYVAVFMRCMANQLIALNRDRDDKAISLMLCTGA